MRIQISCLLHFLFLVTYLLEEFSEYINNKCLTVGE